MREARIHVRHIRDLLKSLDPSDAYNGVDCNSLSFLSIFTDGDLGGNDAAQPTVCKAVETTQPSPPLCVCVTLRERQAEEEGQRAGADRLHPPRAHPARQQRAPPGAPPATEQGLEGEETEKHTQTTTNNNQKRDLTSQTVSL